MTTPTTGDPLADAILDLADSVRAATGRIVDAYLAARWPEADATAYCPTCGQVEGRPDTVQVLVCDLDLGDTVLTADGTRLTITDTDPGDSVIVDFDGGRSHVWNGGESVPVILVDCPVCDGLTGSTGRCDWCGGKGRVKGSLVRRWREKVAKSSTWSATEGRWVSDAREAAERRLSMEEADIVAGGVA